MNRKIEVATSLAVAGGLVFHALTMEVEIIILDSSGRIVCVRPEHVEERPISGHERTLRNFAPTVAVTGTATPWPRTAYVVGP